MREFYKKPIIAGIVIAAIIHSMAILTRELFPISALVPVIDALAFNGSWIYLVSIGALTLINRKKVGIFFACIPRKITEKTVEGQRLVLTYEFVALVMLLFAFPAVTYFYTQVEHYFSSQHPELNRFIDYMPFTDLINRAMTSFPFFITLFTLLLLLCVIMPHNYLSYKCMKKARSPLNSAILFSVLLSTAIVAISFGLLLINVESWMVIALVATGPVVLITLIIINVMMLRYHDKFVFCDASRQ